MFRHCYQHTRLQSEVQSTKNAVQLNHQSPRSDLFAQSLLEFFKSSHFARSSSFPETNSLQRPNRHTGFPSCPFTRPRYDSLGADRRAPTIACDVSLQCCTRYESLTVNSRKRRSSWTRTERTPSTDLKSGARPRAR